MVATKRHEAGGRGSLLVFGSAHTAYKAERSGLGMCVSLYKCACGCERYTSLAVHVLGGVYVVTRLISNPYELQQSELPWKTLFKIVKRLFRFVWPLKTLVAQETIKQMCLRMNSFSFRLHHYSFRGLMVIAFSVYIFSFNPVVLARSGVLQPEIVSFSGYFVETIFMFAGSLKRRANW